MSQCRKKPRYIFKKVNLFCQRDLVVWKVNSSFKNGWLYIYCRVACIDLSLLELMLLIPIKH